MTRPITGKLLDGGGKIPFIADAIPIIDTKPDKVMKKIDVEKEIKEMPFELLFTKIMVMEKRQLKEGSIHIPSASKEMRATEGIVLAVGLDVTDINVGDEIYYGQYSGVEVKRGDKEYRVMNDVDVIAIIKKEACND